MARPRKQKIDKCDCGSGKSKLRCNCREVTTGKGKNATVTSASGQPLCTVCGAYLFSNGMCRNMTCSTRQ